MKAAVFIYKQEFVDRSFGAHAQLHPHPCLHLHTASSSIAKEELHLLTK